MVNNHNVVISKNLITFVGTTTTKARLFDFCLML